MSTQVALPPRRVARRTVRLLSVLLAALGAGSCSFLADEFTWLDRAGPVADPAATAAPSGTAERP